MMMTSNEETPQVIKPTFEIKIAFVGNVSAGKSTLLNALLGDKFSEVALKRTTACVNYFRVTQEAEGHLPNLQKADTVLQEISTDNRELGNIESIEIVKEKTFQVAIDLLDL